MEKSFKYLRKTILRLFVTFIIIVAIAFIPSMYEYDRYGTYIQDVAFSPDNYFVEVGSYFGQLIQGDFGAYDLGTRSHGLWGDRIIQTRDVSWELLGFFKTTLQTFLPALFFGITFGIVAAYITLWFKSRWKNITHFLSFFLLAIPDFFVILILQFIVIYIYKNTGVRLFAVATGGSSEAIFLPIFSLSLLPFAYMYRIALNSFEDVLTNRFIQTAYSKGLNKFNILWTHVSKNGLIIALNNIPSIIMPTISNLFIVEYMFNTKGITTFVFSHYWSTDALVASVFLIWFMVEAVLFVSDFTLRMITRHRRGSYA